MRYLVNMALCVLALGEQLGRGGRLFLLGSDGEYF